MLFDMAMEALHFMLRRATDLGILSALARRGLNHKTSMYADDVVTFIRPTWRDIHACLWGFLLILARLQVCG